MEGSQSFWGIITTGGAVIYPLIACSIITVTIIIERLWALGSATRSSTRLHKIVADAVDDGSLSDAATVARSDTSPLAAVYKSMLSQTDDAARTRIAAQRLGAAVRSLKRNIWLIGTVGSLAPFIGLLGTVLGIVRSFDDMAKTGSGGFAVVAAGISEALNATALGLLVGVLSIFAYNAFMIRIANLAAQWRDWTEELLVRLSNPPVHEGSVPRVVHSR